MRRVLIVVGAMLALWAALPLAAQTPTAALTPSPTRRPAELPYDSEFLTLIAFPHQVFFRADIGVAAADITSLALIIETINGTRTEVIYPTEEPFLFASDQIIATYVWEIPSENPPPLFQPLRYTWRVIDSGGQTFDEVRTIEFSDERTSWTNSSSLDNAVVVTAPQTEVSRVLGLRNELSETLRLLQQQTNQTQPLRLLVYSADVPPGCSLNAEGQPIYYGYDREGTKQELACDPDQAEAIYRESAYSVVQLSGGRNLIPIITDQVVRDTYARLWAGRPVPRWFAVGLAQFYQSQPNRAALFTSRETLRGDAPFTLLQMQAEPTLDEAVIWNAQAYGMVLYLAARAGVEDVFALARDVTSADSFDEAFTARMNFDTQALIGAWQNWLFKREAENAYLYTPYLATTATPTLTSTVTPTTVPPTQTITATATLVLSPTPRATITRRPPTPTVTPLPASGFNLRPTSIPPTPIDTTPLAVITRGSNPLIIGGGLLAILVVILISLMMSRRRP